MRTVLLFGTFDGLHEGHRALIKEARQHGDKVVVALALDDVVRRLKGHEPAENFEERAEALENSGFVDEVVAGDEREGDYEVLNTVKPDLIAFGYDQTQLQADFERFLKETGKKIPTITLAPFEPERYKSSLLRTSQPRTYKPTN